MAELDCELCERDWLFGEAGFCNESVGVCECTDGFTGVDDWAIAKTCHVNVELAYYIHVASFAIVLLGVAISFTCSIVLMRRWNFNFEALESFNNRIKSLTKNKVSVMTSVSCLTD